MNHPAPLDAEAVTADVMDKYQQFVSPTQVALLKIAGFDHIEAHAEGVTITDAEGNRYMDCLGGYGVFSLGHRHPRVVQAVKDQLDRMPLSSKTFLNKPLADLCARLAALAPGDLQYSFLCNSGTEAVEGALKIARMATGRTGIISTEGGYHGKTMGALSATGRDLSRRRSRRSCPASCKCPGMTRLRWSRRFGAHGGGHSGTRAGRGRHQSARRRLPARARAACDKHGALLIADEVQTGLGRTGTLFAVEHWDVSPDIMTLAKCLGGGVMPVGAFMATPAVWEQVFRANPFIHTSTFGGGEMACAAALAALDVI